MRSFLHQFAKTSASHGLAIWGSNIAIPEQQYEILRHLATPDLDQVEVLKLSGRRSVLRIRRGSPQFPSVVIKGFPLAKIESRLKYKKYGLAEFINYLRASERKIPTPQCYAYFEVRRWGLVNANGLLIEDLRGYRSLDQLAQPDRRASILSRAIPVLKLLFETGVNHIDTSPHNLLESPDGSDMRLIDWQYCSFWPARQLPQLLLQAAHFLRYAQLPAASSEGRQWLEQLHAACDCPLRCENFARAVAQLQSRKKIGADERLRLAIDPVTRRLMEDPT